MAAQKGSVIPLRSDSGFAALLHWQDGVATLRVSETVVNSHAVIDELEVLARQHTAHRIETQGKFASKGVPAQLLKERGFYSNGPSSIHFKVEVAKARSRLKHLKQRLGDRQMTIMSVNADHVALISHIVHDELILDSFELQARLTHQGYGSIHKDECPVLVDGSDLVGFILTSRFTDPAERELIVRWVAPHHRRASLVNLALMLECLDRAAAAGVETAYFSANPQRHNDTMRLAYTLQAEQCGESLALMRDLD